MQLRELARLNGTLREDDNRSVLALSAKFHVRDGNSRNVYVQHELQSSAEDRMYPLVSVGSFVLGRILSHAASPTPPFVQSVAEQVTSPPTASTPGDHQFI